MTDSSAPYYPNYPYVGPPSKYNGTGTTGGNSGTLIHHPQREERIQSKEEEKWQNKQKRGRKETC
jgi:hypothetical protein